MPSRVTVRTQSQGHHYEVLVGTELLPGAGKFARLTLGKDPERIALISNRKVFKLYGAGAVKSLNDAGFAVSNYLMGDGEQHKSLRTLEKTLTFLAENKLERTDAIVSLGGGVVGDLAGFAAATYLRGVRYIQIPTTLLAQVDSSVGGKTGVNLPAGKNLVGSFYPPAAVLIDTQTLATLPAREQVAGWCECIKHGAVGDKKLLRLTTEFLKNSTAGKLTPGADLEKLIAKHVAFKARIVAADEFENPLRVDHGSRKILNFGHTVAHALEAVTNYKRFRHGEAVGHGMLVAAQLSKNLGLAPVSELELLTAAVRSCGPLPSVKNIDERDIVAAVGHDKKRKQGSIQWVLLEGIGRPRIIDGEKVSRDLLLRSVREVFKNRVEDR